MGGVAYGIPRNTIVPLAESTSPSRAPLSIETRGGAPRRGTAKATSMVAAMASRVAAEFIPISSVSVYSRPIAALGELTYAIERPPAIYGAGVSASRPRWVALAYGAAAASGATIGATADTTK